MILLNSKVEIDPRAKLFEIKMGSFKKLVIVFAIIAFSMTFVEAQVALQSQEGTDPFLHKILKNQGSINKNYTFTKPAFINATNDLTLPWRLPRTVTPYRYNLELIPILESSFEGVPELGEQWSVRGYVEIKVLAEETVNEVKMHVKDLEIEDIQVYTNLFS